MGAKLTQLLHFVQERLHVRSVSLVLQGSEGNTLALIASVIHTLHGPVCDLFAELNVGEWDERDTEFELEGRGCGGERG